MINGNCRYAYVHPLRQAVLLKRRQFYLPY